MPLLGELFLVFVYKVGCPHWFFLPRPCCPFNRDVQYKPPRDLYTGCKTRCIKMGWSTHGSQNTNRSCECVKDEWQGWCLASSSLFVLRIQWNTSWPKLPPILLRPAYVGLKLLAKRRTLKDIASFLFNGLHVVGCRTSVDIQVFLRSWIAIGTCAL